MNTPDLIDGLRRALAPSARVPAAADLPATAECLDDRALAAFVDGALSSAESAAAIHHVADCRRCQSAIASIAGALEALGVAEQFRPGVTERRRLAWTVPVAAAAAFLLLVARASVPDGAPMALSASGPAPEATPEPIAPVGTVIAARSLRWHALAGADRYRVVLFDQNARVMFETQLSDTMQTLPDSVAIHTGQKYFWRVEARRSRDRWFPSELVAFTLDSTKAR